MAEDATATWRPGVFLRGTLEFERVAFFSDAIFAIALTLLVVGLDVPKISDEFSSRELWDALDDMWPQLLMFFISFAVLGSFWLGHHRHFSRLAAIDRRATGVNLVYLALIAFLPFPSGVLGEYADNSVAVILYASCIAAIASLSALVDRDRHPPRPLRPAAHAGGGALAADPAAGASGVLPARRSPWRSPPRRRRSTAGSCCSRCPWRSSGACPRTSPSTSRRAEGPSDAAPPRRRLAPLEQSVLARHGAAPSRRSGAVKARAAEHSVPLQR